MCVCVCVCEFAYVCTCASSLYLYLSIPFYGFHLLISIQVNCIFAIHLRIIMI